MRWLRQLGEAWLDILHPNQVALRIQAQQEKEQYNPDKLYPVVAPDGYRWVFRSDELAYVNFERLGWLILVPNHNRKMTIDDMIVATGSDYWPHKVLIRDAYQIRTASETIMKSWNRYAERKDTVNAMDSCIQDILEQVNSEAR